MAGPAVCRQTPEVGTPCPSGHAGICAGGEGKTAFLPQPGGVGGQLPAATRQLDCIAPEPTTGYGQIGTLPGGHAEAFVRLGPQGTA